VVARDRETAEEFRKAFLLSDNLKQGELLGYPICDRIFFQRVWSYEYDPIWSAALPCGSVKRDNSSYVLEVKDYYPECNIMLRYFGLRAVPHLVCSLKCEESKEFGRKFIELMPRGDKLLDTNRMGLLSWGCHNKNSLVYRSNKLNAIRN